MFYIGFVLLAINPVLSLDAIRNCSTYMTAWKGNGNGSTTYLDQLDVRCPGNEPTLSQFKYVTKRSFSRYKFKCCRLVHEHHYRHLTFKFPYTDDGKGKLYFLERQTVDCGDVGFMNGFQLKRNTKNDKLRYSVDCCIFNRDLHTNLTCYSNHTMWTSSGYGQQDGSTTQLKHQEITCAAGHALNLFELQSKTDRDHANLILNDPNYTGLVRYHYRCCKPVYKMPTHAHTNFHAPKLSLLKSLL